MKGQARRDEHSVAALDGDNDVVLVVEDNRGVRDLLEIVLEDEGYPVETAADGAEALAVLEQVQPAVVVLDLNLPFADGAEVADRLHAWYADDVPIILLTASSRAASAADRVGAIAYFQKPFNLSPVIAAIRMAAARSHRLL